MKEILMFVQAGCPHCKRALKWHEALTAKFHPEWAQVPLRIVDEEVEKELADLLGHSSINTTRIYIISSGEEHRRQIDRMKLLL